MVYQIMSNKKDVYKDNLARFVASKILVQKKRVLLIDCMNYISQYIFQRHQLEPVMDNLFLARIELIYDLVDLLNKVHFNSYFVRSQVFIVSSYKHLLKDLDEAEEKFYRGKITKALQRIEEKYSKEVVIMELQRKWVTQYRLKE